MAEQLERWLPNHKVSSSNLFDRKIFGNLETLAKIHSNKIYFGNRTLLSRSYVY